MRHDARLRKLEGAQPYGVIVTRTIQSGEGVATATCGTRKAIVGDREITRGDFRNDSEFFLVYRAPVTPARGAVAYCVCGRRKIPPFGNFEPKKFGLRRGMYGLEIYHRVRSRPSTWCKNGWREAA